MNKLLFPLLRRIGLTPRRMWVAGLGIAIVGEVWAYREPGGRDTISETYEDAGQVEQSVVLIFVGAVIAHLIRWVVTPKPANVTIIGDNTTVNTSETAQNG